MKTLAAVLLLLVIAAPAAAQEPTPFRWTSHEAIPARISDAAVAGQVLVETIHSWRAPDRWDALQHQGCRTLVAWALSEGLKRLIDRERPNHADHKSFPSMHTALAVANSHYQPAIGASVAVTVAWGRQASGWHYGSDVVAGAGIGVLASRVCQ